MAPYFLCLVNDFFIIVVETKVYLIRKIDSFIFIKYNPWCGLFDDLIVSLTAKIAVAGSKPARTKHLYDNLIVCTRLMKAGCCIYLCICVYKCVYSLSSAFSGLTCNHVICCEYFLINPYNSNFFSSLSGVPYVFR